MGKITKIIMCLALIFLCNMSVFALEEEESFYVLDVKESSSTAEYNVVVNFPDSPIAVYEVPDPYAVEPMAVIGDVYQGSISDAILKYMLGFVEPFEDYIIYRSLQHTYVVITGEDFTLNNKVVSGSGLVTTFTTNSGTNATYTLDQSERNFSVNTSNSAYVYSNLDGFSDSLKEVRYEAFTSYSTVMLFIFFAVRDVFKSIFR